MKKLYNKIKQKINIKREKSLYYKNMKLKKENKLLKEKLEMYKDTNHQLIDVITIHNIRIREVFLDK